MYCSRHSDRESPGSSQTRKIPLGSNHQANGTSQALTEGLRVSTCKCGPSPTHTFVLLQDKRFVCKEMKRAALHWKAPRMRSYTMPTPRTSTHLPVGLAAPLRRERMYFTSGRALQSSAQQFSTVSQSDSVNPRCAAFFGLFGRSPSKIARIIGISCRISWYGVWPHNTCVRFQCL